MSSIISLYRKYSEVDKKVALGFVKVKNDLSHIKRDTDILRKGQNNVNDKLTNIEKLIKGDQRT